MTSERSEFEKWVVAILGANPNWRESGDCELAWQSWQARAALATQPADSIAVNRLRLSLVAWDAELAEQDYQLTSDDLREKLRQIHRDIDRLMPDQGQAAVRGAEHE